MHARRVFTALTIALLLALAGCGGGGNTSSGNDCFNAGWGSGGGPDLGCSSGTGSSSAYVMGTVLGSTPINLYGVGASNEMNLLTTYYPANVSMGALGSGAVIVNNRFYYVLYGGARGNTPVAGYTLSGSSLQPITGAPFTVDSGQWMAADQTGHYLFIAESPAAFVNQIQTYAINQTTGALTAVGQPVAASSYPELMVSDRTGKFLYVSARGRGGDSTVYGFAIGSDGTLTALSNSPFSISLYSMQTSPTADLLFGVAGNLSGGYEAGIHGYTIDTATGNLTELTGSPFATTNPAFNLAVHPNGKFVYVATTSGTTTTTWHIEGYSYSNGGMTAVPGSPFAFEFSGLKFNPSGNHMFAFQKNSQNVGAFDVDASGTLSTPSPGNLPPMGVYAAK